MKMKKKLEEWMEKMSGEEYSFAGVNMRRSWVYGAISFCCSEGMLNEEEQNFLLEKMDKLFPLY